ncbi:hypothetical protein BB561_004847 [Smittium simulii]|uniref:Ribosomal protein/NADH dehydrogenase domain-containing protein n=1 Tax=Smittium simulii TaxID=133385 RepID=A0A2T9YDT9_9FUNG|nr:hypothetical protein BB561_004847 [Smittium simulii]
MTKLATSLLELRIHFCPNSPASQGLKTFVLNKYKTLKANQPTLPILIRESDNAAPKIFARFHKGIEKSANVEGLQETEISQVFDKLVTPEHKKALN